MSYPVPCTEGFWWACLSPDEWAVVEVVKSLHDDSLHVLITGDDSWLRLNEFTWGPAVTRPEALA